MKTMLKDALILFLITLIAGFALGFVHKITKEPIEKAELEATTKAYQEVFSDASSFNEIAVTDNNDPVFEENIINNVLTATDEAGNTLGYVFKITSKAGYGGDIVFTMGIKNDGMINGISILSISETAGLGMRAEEVLKPQYANKTVSEFSVTKTGSSSDSQIDAISGATITSNAVTNAVNAGLYYFNNCLGGV